MRRVCLAIIALAGTACAASPEVKQASAEVGAALRELRGAQRSFGAAYQAEIDQVRQLIAQSIVNDAVNRKVADMVDEAFDGDLVRLSATMRNTREAAQRRVQLVTSTAAPRGADPDYQAHVVEILKSVAPGLRRSATLVEAEAPEQAAELRARADEIESDPNAGVGDAEIGALADLVLLESTRGAVRGGLRDLENYVKFLQLVHHQVNEWVATDVKVEGDELARLLEGHADLIGLGGGR